MMHLISIFQKYCCNNTQQFGKRKYKKLQTVFRLEDYAKTHNTISLTELH